MVLKYDEDDLEETRKILDGLKILITDTARHKYRDFFGLNEYED